MNDAKPCFVFDAANLGESMPITTSRWPKCSSSFLSSGSMWMQLMQPGVKKSSSTARPRSSASVNGRATLNHVKPVGKSAARSACARGNPMVNNPPATTMAANRVSRMRFMGGPIECSLASRQCVNRGVEGCHPVLREGRLRSQDVAALQLPDAPLRVAQPVHFGLVDAEGWPFHFAHRIVQGNQQTTRTRRKFRVNLACEAIAHRRGEGDQRGTVVERAAFLQQTGCDTEDVAIDDFDVAIRGCVCNPVMRAVRHFGLACVQMVLCKEGFDRDGRNFNSQHAHALLRKPRHVQRLAAQRHQHTCAAGDTERIPVLFQQRHHRFVVPPGAAFAPALQPILSFHVSIPKDGSGWNPWLALGLVANHFDVVPVRPDDERGVILSAIVRAQTWRAIVRGARRQSRAMESFDLLATCGHERQVKMRRLLRGLEEAQRGLSVRAELDSERSFRYHLHADRFERLQEERLARCIVADSEYNVVEHGFSRGVWSCEVAQPSSKRTLPVASSYSAPTTRTRLLFTASAMIGCAEATREALYATFASIARSSKPSPPPFTMFAMPGRTASVMSQMWPG